MTTPRAAWTIDLPAKVFVGLIRTYQHAVSPWLGPACRFYPTCSEYAVEAVRQHGALRGAVRSLRRLLRCHPFHAGGIDMVD